MIEPAASVHEPLLGTATSGAVGMLGEAASSRSIRGEDMPRVAFLHGGSDP